MTRGTLAYAEYDFNRNCFCLHISEEFNGDMGVDMIMGEKTMKRLSKTKTPDHFEKVVYETIHDFGYEDDYDSEDPADTMRAIFLDEGIGIAAEKSFKIDEETLSRTFNYSDYEYVAAYRKAFYIEDKAGKTVEVAPGQPCVFCFGEYVGKISEDGSFLEEKES